MTVLFEAMYCLRLQRTPENFLIIVEGIAKVHIPHFGMNLASTAFSGLERISICMAFAILSRYIRMDSTSMSLISVIKSDKSVLALPSHSLMSVTVDTEDSDMFEVNVVEGPFGGDMKYVYEILNGKAKIFRVNRPMLGSRK